MTDNRIRSSFSGMVWPAVPPDQGALLLSLQFQLDRTQWWPAAELQRHQLRQLELLLRHASATVPFHRDRLASAGFDPGAELTLEGFRPCRGWVASTFRHKKGRS